MAVRESFPISENDLVKYVNESEQLLKNIKGKEDLLAIYSMLTPQERYRPLPEELALFYGVRHATCLFYYFYDLLKERTGLQQDVADARSRGIPMTPAIQMKAKFVGTFSLFVLASSIVARCEKMLNGKDKSKLSRLDTADFDFVVGGSASKDLQFMFSYYVDALRGTGKDGALIIQNPGDLYSTSIDFWSAVAKRATGLSKDFPAELLSAIENSVFRDGTFVVTGFQIEEYKEARVVTWAPVEPKEVVGDQDVTINFMRFCDRVALYDQTLQRNPFAEFGGLVESIFLDGPPGTGKTTRFKMMATRLQKLSEMLGMTFVFKTLSADQVKSEWYGKTAQLIKEFLGAALDPSQLVLLTIDDIDLLMNGDRNASGSSGGDKDIMNGLMQFTSGTGTNYIGNYITVAASNKPTGIDDALRQRFVYRAIIKGPQVWEDYADITALELRKFSKTGLLQIPPGKYEPLKRELPKRLADIYSKELKNKYAGKKVGSWDDIGKFCEELRKKDPSFTGRPVKNAIQVAVANAADFEVPQEWYEDPSNFRAKPFDKRLEMIKSLYKPLTTDMVLMAIEHQFESETRYRREEFERKTDDFAESMRVQTEAMKRMK